MAFHEIPTKYTSAETGEEMINFHKLRLIAGNCLNITMFQLELHSYKEDPNITQYIQPVQQNIDATSEC